MRVGTMLKDVLESIFRRPATVRYPFERKSTPSRLRGKLVWDPTRCTGCTLCAKDCPSNAIELIVIDKAKKQFVMRYHMDRCTFCAQCVQNCRFKCMGLSNEDWEMAALNKEPFTVYYGNEANLQLFKEMLGAQEPGAGQPAAGAAQPAAGSVQPATGSVQPAPAAAQSAPAAGQPAASGAQPTTGTAPAAADAEKPTAGAG